MLSKKLFLVLLHAWCLGVLSAMEGPAPATLNASLGTQLKTAILGDDHNRLQDLASRLSNTLNSIKIKNDDEFEYSPLGFAALHDKGPAVEILCRHGAQALTQEPGASNNSVSPFFLAIDNYAINALQALCKYATAEINTLSDDCTSGFPESPLEYLLDMKITHTPPVHEDLLIKMATILLASGANPGAEDFQDETLFHFALSQRYYKLFAALCKHPQAISAIDKEDTYGISPLVQLLTIHPMENDVRCFLIKMLVDAGANTTSPNSLGFEPIHYIAGNEHLDEITQHKIYQLLLGKQNGTKMSCLAILRKIQAHISTEKDFDILRTCIFQNATIQSDDRRDISLLIQIDDILTSQLLASAVSEGIKKQITQFFATVIADSQGNNTTIKDYLAMVSHAQAAAKKYPTPPQIQANIESARSHLAAPDRIKPTATIIPLPTLMQTAPIGKALYEDTTQGPAAWERTCGFYAAFHLVNTWKYRTNPVEMVKHFSRNNFSEYLALLRSGKELIPMLKSPDLTGQNLYLKRNFYPTICANLAMATNLPLGSSYFAEINALTTSYAFLNNIQDSALEYTPWASNPSTSFALFYANATNGDFSSFITYLKHKAADPAAFVFPLHINTPGHASSALVYKLTDTSGAPKQFYVFFAESNQKPGHQDTGISAQEENFNFSKLFKQLFATLTETTESEIAIAGPTEHFENNDLYSLLTFCENQITRKDQIYAWKNPHEIITRIRAALIEDNMPELARLCKLCKRKKINLNTLKIPWGINHRYSPLGFATIRDNYEAVAILCRYGAKALLQETGELGNTTTPYFLAIGHHFFKALQALCQYETKGIDTPAVVLPGTNLTTTPLGSLMYLTATGSHQDHENLINWLAYTLIAGGADIKKAINDQGESLLHYAIKYGYPELVKTLCRLPSIQEIINLPDKEGKTPLRALHSNKKISKNSRRTILALLHQARAAK